jgi:hypothetical protein
MLKFSWQFSKLIEMWKNLSSVLIRNEYFERFSMHEHHLWLLPNKKAKRSFAETKTEACVNYLSQRNSSPAAIGGCDLFCRLCYIIRWQPPPIFWDIRKQKYLTEWCYKTQVSLALYMSTRNEYISGFSKIATYFWSSTSHFSWWYFLHFNYHRMYFLVFQVV